MTFTYNLAMSFDMQMLIVPGATHLWSISGEEQFYIAFPFMFVLLKRNQFIYCMLGILFLSPVLRAVLAGGIDGAVQDLEAVARRVKFFTPVHFDSFAAGSLIALVTSGREVTRRQGYLAFAIGTGALALYIAVYAGIQSSSVGGFGVDAFRDLLSGVVAGNGREVFSYTAVWLASAGLIIAVLAKLPFVTQLCRPRIFHAMGKISYGGYVYHGLALELLTWLLPPVNALGLFERLIFFLLLLALSIGAAAASYRWLERPFLKLKPTYGGESKAIGESVRR